jgi:hypothetical protein
MASSGAYRVAVPEASQPRAEGGYSVAFEMPIGEHRFLTPEQWARATFEGAPVFVDHFLTFGWRFVLGLRLGPKSSPTHVAGWPIESSGPDSLTLEARSRRMVARNTVVVRKSTVTVVTHVHFERRSGRVLWAAVAPLHHVMIPYLLTHALT